MKVNYRTVLVEGEGSRALYKAQPSDACCGDMVKALDECAVVFSPGIPHPPALFISYGDGEVYQDYIQINFCPFCGSGVETAEVERVRRISEGVGRFRYEEVPE